MAAATATVAATAASPLKSDLILLTVCKTLSFNFANYTRRATRYRGVWIERGEEGEAGEVGPAKGACKDCEYANVHKTLPTANANVSGPIQQRQHASSVPH